MSALVVAVRVTRTGLSCHIADRRKFSAAIFASVAVFLIALVEFVLSAVDAVQGSGLAEWQNLANLA